MKFVKFIDASMCHSHSHPRLHWTQNFTFMNSGNHRNSVLWLNGYNALCGGADRSQNKWRIQRTLILGLGSHVIVNFKHRCCAVLGQQKTVIALIRCFHPFARSMGESSYWVMKWYLILSTNITTTIIHMLLGESLTLHNQVKRSVGSE